MINREKKEKIPPSAMFLQIGWERDDVILKDPNSTDRKEKTFLENLKQTGVVAPEDANLLDNIEDSGLDTDEDIPENEDDDFKRSSIV